MEQVSKRLSRSVSQGEKGFTLIELLIVVAILGVLAAVAVPNVSRFIGRGQTEAKAAELATVRSAMQAMMIDLSLSEVATVVGSVDNATNGMPIFPNSTYKLFPDYMQTANTTYYYYTGSSGNVSQRP